MIECDPVLKESVVGVYAADRLPRKVPGYPYGFIPNTDIQTKPGQHWCAFYDDGSGHIHFFDSFGRPPSSNSEYFEKWIREHAKTLTINRSRIQSDSSVYCGLYCILILRKLIMREKMEDIINLFDEHHTEANDSYVFALMTLMYPECIGQNNGQTCSSFCANLYI